MNLQLDKAGNLGDIIKHSALVETAKTISHRNPGSCINYLDTHAFQIIVNLNDPGSWHSAVSKLDATFSGYKDYIATEQPYVLSGRYLCSCGLAIEYLTKKRLFLAEADNATRRRLRRQLSSVGCEAQILLSDMHDFTADSLSMHSGPLLALVDPFHETEDEWQSTWVSAKTAIEALHKDDMDGAVLVFQYQREASPLWLAPPSGFLGPVAVARFKPYYVALYCTRSMIRGMTERLVSMGWYSCLEEGDR